MMEHRLLGHSGLKVPLLSFGTGTFGGRPRLLQAWGDTDVAEATAAGRYLPGRRAARCSTRADVYSDGAAEEILGQAIKGRARPAC